MALAAALDGGRGNVMYVADMKANDMLILRALLLVDDAMLGSRPGFPCLAVTDRPKKRGANAIRAVEFN